MLVQALKGSYSRAIPRLSAQLVVRGQPFVPVRLLASAPAVAESVTTDVAKPASNISVVSSKPDASAVGPSTAEIPRPRAEEAPPPPPAGASTWQRLTAFLTGVGVSAVFFYYTISHDLHESSEAIDRSLSAFKADAVSSNTDLRQRVARIEHELAALKK